MDCVTYFNNLITFSIMRKIENGMCAAVKAHQDWHLDNTEVKVECDNVKVYLYGNLIYKKQGGVASFTLAGWNSNTTRRRLCALGVSVRCRDYTPQMDVDGEWVDISSNEWYNVEG